MSFMFVTLDVSKLSGWLNADAYCRESKEGYAVRVEVYGSGGSRRWKTAAHAACRGARDCRLGAGHGEERTWNMDCMAVTLDVSKLSGWLNARAYCRAGERPGGVRACGCSGASGMHGADSRLWGLRHRRGAHVEERRACDAGRGARSGRRGGWGARGEERT